MRAAIAIIADAHAMMQTVSRKYSEEFRIATVEASDFATERFLIELDRLEDACARDFKGAGSLLTRRRSTLSSLFFDSIVLKVIHVFEIADREVRTWMNAFIRPIEAQLSAFQEQVNNRLDGMGRIQNADTDLAGRIEELRALTAEVQAHSDEWDRHNESLMTLLEFDRDHSLA
jgi:hypothetical protein